MADRPLLLGPRLLCCPLNQASCTVADNQYIGVEVLEGLRADHREESLGDPAHNYTRASNFTHPANQWGSWAFGDPLQNSGYALSVTATGPTEEISEYGQVLNRYLVFKRCKLYSNAGFNIGSGADILLENNGVWDSRPGKSYATPGRVGPYQRTPAVHPPPFLVAGETPGCAGCGTSGVLLRGNIDHGATAGGQQREE